LSTNDNKKISAHKLILASHSKVLLDIFENDNNESEIAVFCDSHTMERILKWMYNPTSEVIVTELNFVVKYYCKHILS